MVNQTITQLPTPPSTTDVVNFNDRADNFLAAIPTFVTQANTVIGQINSTETNINSKESSATNAAGTATTQAGIATTKASEASASATAAYNAQLAAEAVFDNFDDKYLGAKATAPTVDNDGNTLVTGALYFRTTAPKGIYVYDAELSAWSIFSYIPTSHGTLSGRSDAGSHPMDAITGLIEALLAKAPLSSPSLTGTPTAPTQASTDNSTRIATTAFVKALLVSASQTVSGLIEIATNAEVQAGTDTVKAITPAGLFSAYANNKTANGYTKLPNGLIIQWGSITISGTGTITGTITFPLAFPNALRSIAGSLNGSYTVGTGSDSGLAFYSETLSAVTCKIGYAYQNTVVRWIAIGY